MTKRRTLLAGALAAAPAALGLTVWPAPARAAEAEAAPRLVFIILRGGLDGLSAVPAPGDPAFADARGELGRFADAPLPLGGPFALHPLLAQMHTMYAGGELAVLHAVGSGWHDRSHFDAQQVLESGGSRPYELATGWLGRAVAALADRSAVALGAAVPLALRGARSVDTWAPSQLPEPATDLVERLRTMYHDDPALAQALERASAMRQDPALEARDMAGGPIAGRAAAVALARQAAQFLQRGSQVAMLELGGWDSHANQAAPQGALSYSLRSLDEVFAALREGLQPGGTWQRSVIFAATEFGRAVAINGTRGTDHGSAGAAFLAGGAVRGGRVISDWPGLAAKDRFEGRDLRVTTEMLAVQRSLLTDHLRVARSALDSTVLPASAGMKPIELLRA